MNKQENDKQTTLEDLSVDEVRQSEVKGGDTQILGKTYYVGSANGGVWK